MLLGADAEMGQASLFPTLLAGLAYFSIHESRRRLRWECEADSEPTPFKRLKL
jgi:hypothetical protein